MKNQKYDVIVIGGGAAGMLSAGTAASFGKQTLLLNRNGRLGWKLSLTGKGRCNVTNNCTPETVRKNVLRNPQFLFSALSAFPPSAVLAFFEREGCQLKTERGGRVFPVSERAQDVVAALTRFLAEQHVQTVQALAERLAIRNGAVIGVETDCGVFFAPQVIVCTGGKSYPVTGSDGSGYQLARQAGHTVIPPEGSLVPLCEADGELCIRLAGLTLRNVGIRLLDAAGKTLYTDFGELAFEKGILTGPTMLSASAHVLDGETGAVEIDLKPGLEENKLDARLLRDLETYRNLTLEKALTDLLPKSMIPEVLRQAGLDGAQMANSVTRVQRQAMLRTLKAFSIPFSGKRPIEEAIVTAGGVDVRELNPKTMESKKVQGLYFAGEILNVDAYTGGFNLQIAWSTGFAAGTAAGKSQPNVIQ